MPAIPHASGLPMPSPSRSGGGSKKGAFPPTPKSVRVWAVLEPAPDASQSESAPSATDGQLGHADASTGPEGTCTAKHRHAITAWVALALFGAVLAYVVAVLLGKHLPI